MADLEKLAALVEKTMRKTERREIDWKTTASDEVVIAVINEGKHILKSFAFTNSSDEFPRKPSLSLWSRENKLLVDITEQEVNSYDLSRLHELAVDQATGLSDALDEVLTSLDKEDLPF